MNRFALLNRSEPRGLYYILLLILLALAYWGAAKLSLLLTLGQNPVAPLWLPAGLALVAVFRLGYGVWPGISLGVLLTGLSIGAPLPLVLCIAIGNAAAAISGVCLLKRIGWQEGMTRVVDVLALIGLGAMLAPVIGASAGVGASLLFTPASWEHAFPIGWTWWLGDVLGIILIAPAMLVWTVPGALKPLSLAQIAEYGVLILTLSAAVMLALYFGARIDADGAPLHYLVFPPLVWAAMRFGQRAATLLLLLVAVAFSSALLYSDALLSAIKLQQQGLNNSGFLFVLTTTILLVAAVFEEKNRSASALRESEAQRHRAEQASSIYINKCDLDGRFITFHPKFPSLLGYTEKELQGLSFQNLTHPDDLAADLEQVERLKRGDITSFSMEKRYFHKNRNILWLNLTCSIATDDQGQPSYLLAYLEDITRRKQAEEQLQKSERRLRDFAESVSDWFWETDAELRYSWLSEQFERITGLAPSALLGKTRLEAAQADANDPHWRQHLAQLQSHEPFRDFEFVSPSKRWLQASGVPIYDSTGRFQGYRGASKDITILREAQHRADKAQAQFLQAIEVLPMAIALYDEQDRLLICNDAYSANLLAAGKQPKPGETFTDIVRTSLQHSRIPSAQNREEEWLQQRLRRHRQGRATWIEIQISEQRWLEIREHPLPDGQLIITEFDSSERKRMEVALREAKDAAEAANRAKSEFLAKMSHEIRTPMNGVLGIAELLQGTVQDEQQQQFVHIIQTASQALMCIIDDIFDFATIDTGQLRLAQRAFDFHQLMAEVSDMLSTGVQAKNLELRVVIDPKVPQKLYGDADRLRQILLNLLNNAIKYTQQGSIELRIGPPLQRKENQVCLRFEVEDTGIGIAPELHAHIFEAFAQGDDSHRRLYGGTGLGLAICRELVTLMGGDIGLNSQPGKGSVFWFTVLLQSAGAKQASPRSQEQDRVSAQLAAHVLLAEDNEINQQVARLMLEQLGCTVNVVEDGQTALTATESQHFDLILMDCQMPIMDGYQATREIRRREETRQLPRTPIIALTANVLPESVRRCHDVGMDEHLSKPISKQSLSQAVQRWVS